MSKSFQKEEKEKSELEERVLFINRCSKVLKGGRKFSFSALIVVGDQKGKVGFGFAKANEVTDAIRKAVDIAKADMMTVKMEGTTIPHQVIMEWDGARILLKPAPEGTGVIAGSKIRAILELAGVKDIVAKNLGSSNPINQVRATFKGLQSLRDREEARKLRGVA